MSEVYYICEDCREAGEYECGWGADQIRVLPDGRHLCEGCFECGDYEQYGKWADLPSPADELATLRAALDAANAKLAEMRDGRQELMAAFYKAWPDAEDLPDDTQGMVGLIEQLLAERDAQIAVAVWALEGVIDLTQEKMGGVALYARAALSSLPASAQRLMRVVEIAKEEHEDCQQSANHRANPRNAGSCQMCEAITALNGEDHG